MNCKNCNAEVPESATFCPTCGQAVEKVEAPTQETNAQYMNFTNMNAENPGTSSSSVNLEEPPKKDGKKKILGIVLAAVAAVAVLIGVTSHAQIGNFVKKTFGSPESYYQYVETKSRDTGKKVFVNYYDTVRKNAMMSEQSQSATYKLEVGQSLKTMLSMTGIDCSKLDNVEMAMTAKQADKAMDAKAKLLLNGTDLLSMNLHMNYDTKEYYMQIPELSDKYIDYTSMMQSDETGDAFAALADMQKYLPETAVMDKIITTYTDLMIKQMDTVEKSKTTVEANGVKMDCTDLKVTCNGEKLYAMLEQLLTTMKDDLEIKKYVEGIDKEAYASFVEAMENTLKDIKEGKENFLEKGAEAVMNVYVDGEGTIIGRVLAMTVDGSTLKITGVEPTSGSDFGYRFAVQVDDKEYFTILGKGTRKGGKTNGEYTISMDESANPAEDVITSTKDMINIKVTDLDEDAWEKDGYLNGTVTLSTQVIAPLASYELQMASQGNAESASSSISIVCAGDKMATLTVTAKEATEEIGSMKPAEDAAKCDVNDPEAMEAYTQELKLDDLFAKIKEVSGIDLSQYAETFRNMGESDEPSLEDYEYDLSDDYDLSSEDLDLDEYDLESEEDGPTDVIGFGL